MCTIVIAALTQLNRTSRIKLYKIIARSRLFCRIAKRSIERNRSENFASTFVKIWKLCSKITFDIKSAQEWFTYAIISIYNACKFTLQVRETEAKLVEEVVIKMALRTTQQKQKTDQESQIPCSNLLPADPNAINKNTLARKPSNVLLGNEAFCSKTRQRFKMLPSRYKACDSSF